MRLIVAGLLLAAMTSVGDGETQKAMTGREMLTLKGHTSWVYSVAFSADGKRLASASDDKTVKVWDAQMLTPEPK